MAKRGQGEGSIRRRPDGTWEARITVGISSNGNQKRKSIYGKTRQEVQKKMTSALNEINNGNYTEPSKMTMNQWLDIWLLEYKKHSIKSTTYINYVARINNHIKPLIGEHKLKDLRVDFVQKMINDMNVKNLSPETIRGVFNIVHSALEQAMDNGLISKNPAVKITLPKIEKKYARVLSADEQRRFIVAARTTYMGEIFILGLGTGLRIGELLALKWENIDFENGLLQVSQTLNITKDYGDIDSKWKKTFGTPKTASSVRSIPLLPNLTDMLSGIEFRQSFKDTDLVFSTNLGLPLDPRNMRRKFCTILKKAGLSDDINIHCLRHTFATRGLENGIEMKVMQELMGHASLRMTADLYTHVLPDKKKDAIMKLKDTIVL